MPNGANRIFKLMQKSGTDTISEMISLTVQSINPIILTDGDRLTLTEDFLYFDSYIDKSNIKVGDKFITTTYNNGQTYYVYDVINSSENIDVYLQKINNLQTEVQTLQGIVQSLDTRVTALENQL